MKNILALRPATSALAVVAFLLLSACNGTTLKDSWVAPDVTKLSFKSILVIAATSDATTRRIFEDNVAAAAPQTHVVSSYALFGDKVDITDAAKVTAAVRATKFDAVVVMRLVSDRAETTVNQTSYPVGGYNSMYGYGMGYGYGYGPGYRYAPVGYRSFGSYYGGYAMTSTTVTTDHILSIETGIYELPGEKLVWSGVTETKSPGSVKQMAKDVVTAIRQEMLEQHLIGPSAK